MVRFIPETADVFVHAVARLVMKNVLEVGLVHLLRQLLDERFELHGPVATVSLQPLVGLLHHRTAGHRETIQYFGLIMILDHL